MQKKSNQAEGVENTLIGRDIISSELLPVALWMKMNDKIFVFSVFLYFYIFSILLFVQPDGDK